AAFAVADGVHEDTGVLVDNRFLLIIALSVHGGRQDADDRHQREADDRQADGDLDHGEAAAAPRSAGVPACCIAGVPACCIAGLLTCCSPKLLRPQTCQFVHSPAPAD